MICGDSTGGETVVRSVRSGETVSGTVRPVWSEEILDTGLLPDGVREFRSGEKSFYLNVRNHPLPGPEKLREWKEEWLKMLGRPSDCDFPRKCELRFKFSLPECDGELYHQNNATGRFQRTMLLLPRRGKAPYPVVIMPFYTPSRIIGFDPETGVEIPLAAGRSPDSLKRGLLLAEAGFAVLSCDSYHVSYIRDDTPEDDFSRWARAGEALLRDNPDWSGVGKLVADNRLLADLAEADPRLDGGRIGIMGHSLGGKIAFYVGGLDPRIRCSVASDWGFGWHQTNWDDVWYWGEKLKELERKNMEHSQLLAACGTPLLAIAGHNDDEGAAAFLDRAAAIRGGKGELLLDNHGQGHTIPPKSFTNAVAFLRKYLN